MGHYKFKRGQDRIIQIKRGINTNPRLGTVGWYKKNRVAMNYDKSLKQAFCSKLSVIKLAIADSGLSS